MTLDERFDIRKMSPSELEILRIIATLGEIRIKASSDEYAAAYNLAEEIYDDYFGQKRSQHEFLMHVSIMIDLARVLVDKSEKKQ
jgi:Cdc6-like AAA superfamily ATPase